MKRVAFRRFAFSLYRCIGRQGNDKGRALAQFTGYLDLAAVGLG